jgi:outer membrane protein OmpA-like peptidoglycan-associated protein
MEQRMAADVLTVPAQRDAFVPRSEIVAADWFPALIGFISLLVFAVLAAISVYVVSDRLEQRIEQNVVSRLQAGGVNTDGLRFDWRFRDVIVEGDLDPGQDTESFEEQLRRAGGRDIRGVKLLVRESEQRVPDNLGTVDVSAQLQDGKLTLEGSVLTDEQRRRLIVAATDALGIANVTDRLSVSGLQEAIPGADERVAGLADAIAGVNSAMVVDAQLSARDLRFNATAPDQPQADSLRRLRGSASDLGLVISGDIIARKSNQSVSLDVTAIKEAGRITLEGSVHSPEQWRALDDAARVASKDVVNDVEIVEVNGDESAEADAQVAVLATAMTDFQHAETARARLTSNQFDLTAAVDVEENATAMNRARAEAAALGMELQGAISSRQRSVVSEVELLQNAIRENEAELKEALVWESGDDQLSFAAKQSLDRVVDALIRYQRPVLVVTGHTDSDGPADINRELSLSRASAVVDYLIRSGVDSGRLRALGYGEAAPLASNSTAFGRRQNRRVEFRVLSEF